MEFYLVKKQQVNILPANSTFQFDPYRRSRTGSENIFARKLSLQASIEPSENSLLALNPLEELGIRDKSISLTFDLVDNSGGICSSVKTEGTCLTQLYNEYGDSVKVNVELDSLQVDGDEGLLDVNFQPMLAANMRMHENKGEGHVMYFEDSKVGLSNNLEWYWTQGCQIKGNLTVGLVFENVFAQGVPKDSLSVNRKLLHEEVACDMTILARKGVPVKCHRSFLSAQSPVFEAMFRSNFKESQTGIIDMPDMSEKAVKAFLAFVYYWDTHLPGRHSGIAFELLQAGHKYNVIDLEKCMRRILLGKPSEWYTVDVAIDLFFFAMNIVNCDDLKKKAFQVLKSNYEKLEASQTYRKLFQNDPIAAMELCKYAIFR